MRKVIRYEEPPKKGRTNWSCWKVYIDFGDGKETIAYMNKFDFDVLMKEQELMAKRYELKDLEEYKERHPEDSHDPTPLELYCDANPNALECRVYDD